MWCELMTTDPTAAQAFYSRLFGWEMAEGPIADMMYTVLKIGDREVGGLMGMPPDMPSGQPPTWGVYITVDDVDASAQLAAELGGIVRVPPTDIPDVGRFAVIQDPQGATLSIITYHSV